VYNIGGSKVIGFAGLAGGGVGIVMGGGLIICRGNGGIGGSINISRGGGGGDGSCGGISGGSITGVELII
jgi:hypothetical protein